MYYFCHTSFVLECYVFFRTLNIANFSKTNNSYSLVYQKNSYLFLKICNSKCNRLVSILKAFANLSVDEMSGYIK